MANRLAAFDLDVNIEAVIRQMNYDGSDIVALAKKEHARKVFHVARLSAEAVVYYPEMLPHQVVETDALRRKANGILRKVREYQNG